MTAMAWCVLAACWTWPGDLPEPLRKMQETRARLFETAQIEWSLDDGSGPRYYSSRYANGDFALVELGDETGLVEPDFLQYPRMAHPYSPFHHLRTAEGGQWEHRELGLNASYVEPGNPNKTCPMLDIRTMDFVPNRFIYNYKPSPYPDFYNRPEHFYPGSFVESYFGRNERDPTFEVRSLPDGTVEVNRGMGGRQTVWTLDPDRGFLPLRVEDVEAYPGTGVRRRTTDTFYRQWDGRWFPESIHFTDDGNRQRVDIEILYASFDDPALPRRLKVADAMGPGMVPGVNVGYHFADGTIAREPYMFDGEKAMSHEEFRERRINGTLPALDAFNKLTSAFRERLPGREPRFGWLLTDIAPAVRREPKLWEPYTRQFIIFYALSREQTRRAFEILGGCQKRAYAYLDEREDEFKDVADRLAEARGRIKELEPRSSDESQPDAQQADALREARKETARLEDYQKRLYDPIDDMFERCLKKQLQALLTDRQIKDAKAKAIKAKNAASPKPAETEAKDKADNP